MEGELRILKNKDFDLAYLALLSAEGIKPISRYEPGLSDEEFTAIKNLGLNPTIITRYTTKENEVKEVIFGIDIFSFELYKREFGMTQIIKSKDVVKLEGSLFGYPECCVEAFFDEPYQKNELKKEDQEILFHWVCKDCKITPKLLPKYKKIYQKVSSL